jgi:very-short-patch-repair endonuclease
MRVDAHYGPEIASPPQRAVAELAQRQWGVVARRQLDALGLGGSVRSWRANGRLHEIHRGVYAVGHRVLSVNGHLMAAVLACGPGAVVSHRSAAALWGIRRTDRARIDITTARRAGRERRGIDAHLVRRLDPRDVTRHCGIPTTTVARTLIDLADVVLPRALKKAVHESEVLRLLDVTEVKQALGRANGRRNLSGLSDFLDDAYANDDRTESDLEEAFVELCEAAGISRPRGQVQLSAGGRSLRVDFLWPHHRLVVEVDGHASHGTRRGFEDDRRRDADLVAAGYRVMRFTWRQVAAGGEVVTRLRALLSDENCR